MPDPQHRSLLPQLRPYQKEAVRWMICRERGRPPPGGADDEEEHPSKIHELWTEVERSNNSLCNFGNKLQLGCKLQNVVAVVA